MDAEVWAFHENTWKSGKVLGPHSKPGFLRVSTSNGEIIVSKDQTLPFTENSLQLSDDLITLDELNEPSLLYNLEQRYQKGQIYTYIGPMVISVNPYEKLDRYGEHRIPEYRAKKRGELEPHLYAIAQEAYESLVSLGNSQSVIISGESGAGKTEATKVILKYLTVASEGTSSSTLTDAILATNPILEAFGNAKTVRNNNSSRFGKLIKINFSSGGRITGASINNYLLENTRIVFQAPEERNYHIFYQLVKGASSEQRKKYKLLNSPENYKYLVNGDVDCPGLDDRKLFEKVYSSMIKLGLSQDEIDQFMTLLSGILHLGNIEFLGQDSVEVANIDALNFTCDTLGLAVTNMKKALTKRVFSGGGRQTQYSINLNSAQAIENRDAMSKAIYSKMFDYLVKCINQKLTRENPDNKFIAVLDIYGFEIFKNNSMEQFCINYANEKLHEQFNKHLFKAEQEEYKKEGIPWTDIKFKDNKECIELIEKVGNGVLALMTEECFVPKGNDKSLVAKLSQNHKNNKFFGYSLREPDLFEINHYAGSVKYDVNGFLDKNKNTLNADVINILSISDLPILKKLFGEGSNPAAQSNSNSPLQRGGGRPLPNKEAIASKVTVTQIFKKELSNLADLLSSSERHYVRCIKPNEIKAANCFESAKVLTQLKSNGVLETVELRKAGYATKMDVGLFYSRYAALGIQSSGVQSVENFLNSTLTKKEWAMGKTKVFLKISAMQSLEEKRKVKFTRSVLIAQKHVRSYYARLDLSERIRKKREEEERKRREEEERRRREEEERRRKQEEERRRREEEERKRREAEDRRRREEEERQRRKEEEEERRFREQEEKDRERDSLQEEEEKYYREEARRKEELTAKANLENNNRSMKKESFYDYNNNFNINENQNNGYDDDFGNSNDDYYNFDNEDANGLVLDEEAPNDLDLMSLSSIKFDTDEFGLDEDDLIDIGTPVLDSSNVLDDDPDFGSYNFNDFGTNDQGSRIKSVKSPYSGNFDDDEDDNFRLSLAVSAFNVDWDEILESDPETTADVQAVLNQRASMMISAAVVEDDDDFGTYNKNNSLGDFLGIDQDGNPLTNDDTDDVSKPEDVRMSKTYNQDINNTPTPTKPLESDYDDTPNSRKSAFNTSTPTSPMQKRDSVKKKPKGIMSKMEKIKSKVKDFSQVKIELTAGGIAFVPRQSVGQASLQKRDSTARLTKQDLQDILAPRGDPSNDFQNLPEGFPPGPPSVTKFAGKTEEEYKEYMRNKLLRENWENALIVYRRKQKAGDTTGMSKIIEVMKAELENKPRINKPILESAQTGRMSTRLSGVPASSAAAKPTPTLQRVQTFNSSGIPEGFPDPPPAVGPIMGGGLKPEEYKDHIKKKHLRDLWENKLTEYRKLKQEGNEVGMKDLVEKLKQELGQSNSTVSSTPTRVSAIKSTPTRVSAVKSPAPTPSERTSQVIEFNEDEWDFDPMDDAIAEEDDQYEPDISNFEMPIENDYTITDLGNEEDPNDYDQMDQNNNDYDDLNFGMNFDQGVGDDDFGEGDNQDFDYGFDTGNNNQLGNVVDNNQFSYGLDLDDDYDDGFDDNNNGNNSNTQPKQSFDYDFGDDVDFG